MATAVGPLFGVTLTMVTSLAVFCTGNETAWTSARLLSPATVASATLVGLAELGASTTTSRGPLKPGPKPLLKRS